MSSWAYRNCNKCEQSIHINSKCSCGGDPWNIKLETKNKLIIIDKKIAELKKELADYKDRKKVLVAKLKD